MIKVSEFISEMESIKMGELFTFVTFNFDQCKKCGTF